MCALPKWLSPDHRERGVDRFAIAPPLGERETQDLERVQADLPKRLTFLDDPVVLIPARQKIPGQGITDRGIQVLHRPGEDTLRCGRGRVKVNLRRAEDNPPR
jgi:hypothetical protein